MTNLRKIAINYGSKKEVVVTASSGTPQLVGQLSGPVQARVINYDSVKVGFAFGTQTAVTTLTLATCPTMPPGLGEIITIMPNDDGSAVYWNIIGDASPSGAKFEVVLGQGT